LVPTYSSSLVGAAAAEEEDDVDGGEVDDEAAAAATDEEEEAAIEYVCVRLITALNLVLFCFVGRERGKVSLILWAFGYLKSLGPKSNMCARSKDGNKKTVPKKNGFRST